MPYSYNWPYQRNTIELIPFEWNMEAFLDSCSLNNSNTQKNKYLLRIVNTPILM